MTNKTHIKIARIVWSALRGGLGCSSGKARGSHEVQQVQSLIPLCHRKPSSP